MRSLLITANIIIAITFFGCGSKVPIAEVTQAHPDDRIAGQWIAPEKKVETKFESFHVYKFNKKEYLFWYNKENKDSSGLSSFENEFYRFYLLNIGNSNFINAQNIKSIDSTKRAYHFYKYEFMSDSSVKLFSLNDKDPININDFNNSNDLYHFLESNLDNKKLYVDSVLCVRIKE